MQTAYSYINLTNETEKETSQEKFRITSRDMDIIEFILEMKFSTVEDIHSKFFKVTKSGETSNCLRWTRERISNLTKANFLKSVKDICHRTLYITTPKGYLYLKNSRNFKNYSRPIQSIDIRTYEHDQKVILIRQVFEDLGLVKEWVSEKQLSEIDEVKKYLPTEFRPDAIYINAEGKKVAFELEIARKTKERYQQKVNRYIQVMTTTDEKVRLFDEVHYVCEKETVRNLIQDQAVLFQPLFKINLCSDFKI